MIPYVADPDFTLYVGDALEVLRALPDESVHCCVTSPPYWGLRDYGTGTWDGGDPECVHSVGGQVNQTVHTSAKHGSDFTSGQRPGVDASRCRKCGATRVDQQLGLEPTPEEYVARMVAVFAEVRRVLRSDGTCWLNIGDSYATRWSSRRTDGGRAGLGPGEDRARHAAAPDGFKSKDLVGIPWRLAFALQADGWYLRSDIIWAKPNPMPESVTDRPTKAHEYVFLLTKRARYFYDADAIAEPATWYGPNGQPKDGPHGGQMQARAGAKRPQMRRAAELAAQHGLTEAHFEAIRAVGISDTGKALTTTLGAGRSDVEKQLLADEAKLALGGYYREFLIPLTRNARSVWTIQTMQYAEAHFATFPEELPRRCILAGCPEGGTVLDPFMGSGTTATVARKLGRRSVGIELNPEYAQLAAERLSQLSLLADESAA